MSRHRRANASDDLYFTTEIYRRKKHSMRLESFAWALKTCPPYMAEQYRIIDCQMNTEHLVNMGAIDIQREQFERLLQLNN